jgi:hypothetical protein
VFSSVFVREVSAPPVRLSGSVAPGGKGVLP